MNGASRGTWLLRLAGLAGVLGALGWIVGDVLIVGHVADAADFPLLFVTHADRIERDFALRLVGVPTSRLIAGALWAVFTLPLYLAGCWHLWRGVRGAGRWAIAAIALVFVGYAWSPLPHAAFYFVGAAYQALLATPADAHATLLALADEFHGVLLATWYASVLASVAGLLVLSAAIATGRSAYPRWFAITANPLVLAVVTIGLPHAWHGSAGDALLAAGFNTTWLLVYLQSLVLLWNGTDARSRR